MTSTMAAPAVLSGLRRTICTQTSRYHGRLRGGAGRLGSVASIGGVAMLISDTGSAGREMRRRDR